ncbi:MAG: DUF2911 domain-containing protein [Acidobacteriota bacterium]
MPRKILLSFLACALLLASAAFAQDQERPKSPPGTSSTQIGDAWIDVSYSRPILRGRTEIFGSGEEYGKGVTGGGEYWRAGANATTRLTTEVALEVGGKKVPAGEYSLIVGLKPEEWTLVLTSQEAMETWQGREAVEKGLLWGSYGYKPEFDVARAPMEVRKLDHSVDQMTINFLDASEGGVTLAIAWGDTVAMTRLKIAAAAK